MPPPATANLQDVADAARVHRSTVALALRDNPRIPADTRQRIKAIANGLGYRINPLVAALMRSRRSSGAVRHEAIAYVTNHAARYGWRPQHHDRPDFFPGAHQRALEFGYRLEHLWLAEPGMTPERFRDILTARGIHGLIIGRMPPGQTSLILPWAHFSAVALGMTLQSPRLHNVTEHHFDTVWQAMQQCLARGYRRVGFVYSEANDSPRVGDRWLGAYLMQQLQYPADDRLSLCPGAPTDQKTFVSWFRAHEPDALLVTHSAPVRQWLATIGCKVPRDLGMVELQDSAGQSVSGIRYDPAKIGSVAIEMLIGLMHQNETGVPKDHHEVMLSGKWQEGTTLPCRRSISRP
jgi:LacI family transcriptional regulator